MFLRKHQLKQYVKSTRLNEQDTKPKYQILQEQREELIYNATKIKNYILPSQISTTVLINAIVCHYT